MDIRESASVRQRFGSRKLANPLNFSSFGYETANEAEPAESMDAEAAVDGMQSMSLANSKETKKTFKRKTKKWWSSRKIQEERQPQEKETSLLTFPSSSSPRIFSINKFSIFSFFSE